MADEALADVAGGDARQRRVDGQVESASVGVGGERLAERAERLARVVGSEQRRAVIGEGEGDEALAGQAAVDLGEGDRGLTIRSPSRTTQAPIS